MTQHEIDITAIVGLKHSDLYDAAVRCGGVNKMAELIGVSANALYRWVGLKAAPQFQHWSEDRRRKVEKPLFEITGKTLDELFPLKLRQAKEFLNAPKRFERRRTIRIDALLEYSKQTQDRLTIEHPLEKLERDDVTNRIDSALAKLPARNALAVRLRYGLGEYAGREHTYDEMGKVMNVTRERARQLLAKGERLLTYVPRITSELVDLL